MREINRIGLVSGKLTVISKAPTRIRSVSKRKVSYWNCLCECGNTIEVQASGIKNTFSCGCTRADALLKSITKHGDCKTIEFRAWVAMKNRCYNVNSNKYYRYGARGIKVCSRWLDNYDNFLKDMGRRPDNLTSIDRIDVNGDYEPSNCRWSYAKEQMNNMTTNVYLTYNGKTQSLHKWFDECIGENGSMSYRTFHRKIREKGQKLESLI